MNYQVAKIFSRLIFADKKIKIKLLGDSITHGTAATGWNQNGEHVIYNYYRSPESRCWANLMKEHLEAQYNCEVVNNGCTGTTIGFIIDYFDELVDADDDIIVCTTGTNNRLQDPKAEVVKSKAEFSEEFYKNIIKLGNMAKEAGKEIIFVANIPAARESELDNEAFLRTFHTNEIRDMYAKAHFEYGFPFVDLYTAFICYCEQQKIDFEELLADGLHPNDEGYRVMFKLLLREFGLAEKMHNA